MRILIVHPVMSYLGGGERLCCDTIRALLSFGHEIIMVSEDFDPRKIEAFFGYNGLFDRIKLQMYSPYKNVQALGTTPHLIHHLRGQYRALKQLKHSRQDFDLVFSTQDAGYIPDLKLPVIQWGYFPRSFPHYPPGWLPATMRLLPLRLHYQQKVSRIGLILAISQYSKFHLDREWKRPSVLVYPSCNEVDPRGKRDLVVTVARAVPEKRLELFWKIARLRPNYDFVMLLTQDPSLIGYSLSLSRESPSNGRTIFNPPRELYQRLLGEAKVYLHLMEGEHFGITIVEAMSASCVPVVHDSGGPREIATDGIGFRWRNIEEVPNLVDKGLELSPSTVARWRAEDFNNEKFVRKLSVVFSELQSSNPTLFR